MNEIITFHHLSLAPFFTNTFPSLVIFQLSLVSLAMLCPRLFSICNKKNTSKSDSMHSNIKAMYIRIQTVGHTKVYTVYVTYLYVISYNALAHRNRS